MNIEYICDNLVLGLLNQNSVQKLQEGKQQEVLKERSEWLQKRVTLLTLIARVDQIKAFFTDYQDNLDELAVLQSQLEKDINDLTAEMQNESKRRP